MGDIHRAAADYVYRFGYEVTSEVIHDPVQTAYVQFLRLPGGLPYLELVLPDGPKSKLANALSRGGGTNHLCYTTPEIELACQQLRRNGMCLIQQPVDAVPFPGQRIAWLIGRDRVPIELLEQLPP